MKKNIINIVRLICFISITIFLTIKLGIIFTPKGWYDEYQGQIYTIKGIKEIPNNQIDILFLGNSSIQKSVSPMQIYEQTGITSYNYSVSSARIYMDYYFLQNIINYQKPKVVFVDTPTFFYDTKEVEPEQRKSFDFENLNLIKLKMINDNIFETTFEEKASYVFPIFRYHSRWNEVKIKDFNTSQKFYSVTKGFVSSSKLKANKNGYKYMQPNDKKIDMQKDVKEYFYKFIDLCKNNNIEVIFLGVPDTRAWNYESSIKMQELAKETNTIFLDLNDEKKYPINWEKDTEDGGMHMNALGAITITNYIIDYLKDNYSFPDHRNDKLYSKWNEDLKIYQKQTNKAIKEIEKKYQENK